MKNREKNTVRIRIRLVTKFKRDIYKNWFPRIEPITIFLKLNCFIFVSLLPRPIIVVV